MKKIICCILCFAAVLAFAGCSRVGRVKVYDSVEGMIKPEFIAENLVEMPYVSADGTRPPQPEERIFLIKSKEEYDAIFSSNVQGLEIDYNKEMLVLYTFSCYNKREFKITSSEFEEGELDFEFKLYRPFDIFKGPDTCEPYQRFVLIKLNKLNVYDIDFDMDD